MATPERGIVRILRNGRPVGLAFHVGDGWLLTCAHVVNTALGRPRRESASPGEVVLAIDSAFNAWPSRTAGVRHWSPAGVDLVTSATPTGSRQVRHWSPAGVGPFDERDVAVLSIVGAVPPDLPTLRLAAGEVTAGEVQAFGPSPDRTTSGHVRGLLLGAVDQGRLQVNQRVDGILRIRSGFSGGPVWRPDTGEVVGALQATAVEASATDVYVISAPVLRHALAAASTSMPRSGSALSAAVPAELSVLHLADVQFGARHAFGNDGLAEADREGGRLARRLLD